MNSRNMTIHLQDWKLTILYDCGVIQKAILEDYTGHISFQRRDGEIFACDISAHVRPNAVYLKPFGLSIAEDGSYFLLQSWEKGLFCFALPSGELLWKSKKTHAKNVILLSDRAICWFYEQCVDAIDVHSGEVIAHYPLGYDTSFHPLNDNFYLTGPKRGKYHLLDHKLEICETITYQQLNPAPLDHFMIVDVEYRPGGMQISGFEYMRDYYQYQESIGNKDTEQYRFSRFVPLSCFQ